MTSAVIDSVSRSMFSGLDVNGDIPRRGLYKESGASLPLQTSLFFHAVYAPFWLFARICALHYKFSYLSSLSQAFLVLALSAAACVEVVRLYLGYSGNLMEKVPRLVAFWLTSVFLQSPLMAVLLFGQPLSLPFERAIDLLACVFLIFQVVVCLRALRATAAIQRDVRTQFPLNRTKED